MLLPSHGCRAQENCSIKRPTSSFGDFRAPRCRHLVCCLGSSRARFLWHPAGSHRPAVSPDILAPALHGNVGWIVTGSICLASVSVQHPTRTPALYWVPANVSRMHSYAEHLHQTISGLVGLPSTAPRDIKLTHIRRQQLAAFENSRRDPVVWRTPA